MVEMRRTSKRTMELPSRHLEIGSPLSPRSSVASTKSPLDELFELLARRVSAIGGEQERAR